MKYIARPRGGGKTFDLITKYFLNSDNILLVGSEVERKRLIEEYDLSQKYANRIISWHNAKEKLVAINQPVLIDNADRLIFEIIGRLPEIITFTGIKAL